MKRVGNNDITSKQFCYILIGTMLGIGALRLPSALAATSGQDAWISAALGGIYPLLLCFLGMYFILHFPDKNILELSREYLGNFIGTILNMAFGAGFLLQVTTVTQGLTNLFVVSIMNFMAAYKLLSAILFTGAYAAYRDLRILGRINELVYILTIVLSGILIFGFKGGDYRNLLPVLGRGFADIFKGTMESLSSYMGIEILFLIYPCVTERKKAIPAAFKAVFVMILIYVWFTFISIYFIGTDLLPRYIWPVPVVAKAVQIPVISNFRFLFLVLWSIIVFKTIANSFYGTALIFQDVYRKVPKKIIYLLIFLAALVISYQYKDEVFRRAFLKQATPPTLIFNISYILLIITITYLKRGKGNENKGKQPC
ncbi:MAG: GerAB/ArcD/ProY family transporter [Bacillota bacterium]|nr:GerAB/ArcD/ProY family transporter [Bacillota bacterium]